MIKLCKEVRTRGWCGRCCSSGVTKSLKRGGGGGDGFRSAVRRAVRMRIFGVELSWCWEVGRVWNSGGFWAFRDELDGVGWRLGLN
jgi:hypothetical protein